MMSPSKLPARHVWLPEGNGRCCLPHIVYCICHERDLSQDIQNDPVSAGRVLGNELNTQNILGLSGLIMLLDIMKYILASTSTWVLAHSPKMSLSENGDTPSCSSLHQEIPPKIHSLLDIPISSCFITQLLDPTKSPVETPGFQRTPWYPMVAPQELAPLSISSRSSPSSSRWCPQVNSRSSGHLCTGKHTRWCPIVS